MRGFQPTTSGLYVAGMAPTPESLTTRLKHQLREARIAQGLTQRDLAERLDVTQQMLAKVERPTYQPSLEHFERIAVALGFTLDVRLRRIGTSGTARTTRTTKAK